MQNCRTTSGLDPSGLLALINNETPSGGIDVSFWFMEDTRYSTALINAHNRGVPVRVLFDERAYTSYGYTGARAAVIAMRDAGIPMRKKIGSRGIFHWKMMLFAGQSVVQFSGANYSDEAFVPATPYSNYIDEVIMYSDEPGIVDSFKTKFDDVWTDTTTGTGQEFANYANITGSLTRKYGAAGPIDPELSFGPWNSFASRSITRYRAEAQGIDSIMYRITDQRHTNEMIAAGGRGVAVRLISEPDQYRSESKYWHSWNIDRMWLAGQQQKAAGKPGITIRHRKHAGQSHEKLTILHRHGSTGLPMTILGSSNWTSASDQNQQHEHNLFTTKPWIYSWSVDHFNRKWNNSAPGGIEETQPFVPLPPHTPTNQSPANGATGQPTTVTLKWWAGFWAHKYDIYFGTDPGSLAKILTDRELGPSTGPTNFKSFTVPFTLAEGTTYYWRVVSRTMANLEKVGAITSFTTTGTGGPPPPPPPPPPTCDPATLPSGWSTADIGAVAAAGSACQSSGTFTVIGSGADIWNAADEFRFAYRTMTGDGTIVARVASVQNVDPWTKAGVMMRASLAANSAHAAMFVTPGKGLAFQYRATTGGASAYASGGSGTAPYWLRIVRSGSTFTASVSSNGSTWTTVGSQAIAMGSTIYVGIPITSHKDGSLATTTVDSVSVSGVVAEPPPPATCDPASLPAGWATSDIGGVAAAGSACQSGGTFTVTGSGADIWNAADEFRFAYRTLTGDGTITARVATVQNVDAWTKSGVMMRNSLAANSAHASMLVTPGRGLAFQYRSTAGAASAYASGGAGAAPYWVRLTRLGDTFTAYVSANGSVWTTVGSQTIVMGPTIYVGIPTTSHRDGSLARATLDSVAVN